MSLGIARLLRPRRSRHAARFRARSRRAGRPSSTSDIEYNMLPQRMMNAVNSFPLISIPFFMLAGEMMIKAGMMERLIDLANAVVGRVRGGLAHVTMLVGRRPLDRLGLGGLRRERAREHPRAAAAQGVRPGFAAAVVAAAGQPRPDHPALGRDDRLCLHGRPDASRSAGLFMAGVVPGLIMTFGMMGMCSCFATSATIPTPARPSAVPRVLARAAALLDHLPDAGRRDRRHRRRRVHRHRGLGDRGGLRARDRVLRHAHAQARRICPGRWCEPRSRRPWSAR